MLCFICEQPITDDEYHTPHDEACPNWRVGDDDEFITCTCPCPPCHPDCCPECNEQGE